MAAQLAVDRALDPVPGPAGAVPAGAELPRTGRLRLAWPAGFSLDRTVRSHGWYGLAPNAYDRPLGRFHRTLALPDAGPLTVTVHADGLVTWGRVAASRADRAAIRAQLSRMLCLDDDLADLHAACRRVPALSWVPASGAGRLLRSPTVWEDLARTLATTNCSWALTRAMVRRLVVTLGERGPAGELAFPTPAAVARAGVGHLREIVRAGYRARSFVALADTRAPVESWFGAPGSEEALGAEIRRLAGFGPYAAQGMLGLLGRPRGLALDSWVRAKLPRILGSGPLSDDAIAARYAPLGRWAGTGLWLELTRDWFDAT